MNKKKKKTSKLEAFYKVHGKYFVDPTIIMIPKSSKRIVSRLSAKKLKRIDKNVEVAREKILIFLNEFHRGYQMYLADRLKYESVDIHSDKLIKTFGSRKYKIALELMYNNDILIMHTKRSYKVGEFSTAYKLDNDMILKPFIKYTILSEKLQKEQIILSADQIRIIQDNPIAMSVVETSSNITLPTEFELIEHAENLISEGWSNKGKTLAFIKDKKKNDRKIQKLKDSGVAIDKLPKYYYVETGIKLYKSLTENGFMLPKIGNFKSGGRVTTSFTLMPKWIRIKLLVNNSKITGVDYSALHPNIASTLWGTSVSISHQEIADSLGISIHTAKLEHLKFFNTTTTGMEKMVIHTYYEENQPELLENVKKTKVKTYKRTSALMFSAEVNLMTTVISRLDEMNLSNSIIYIYDEIMTTPDNAIIVKQVMEQVASDLNYNLKAKIG